MLEFVVIICTEEGWLHPVLQQSTYCIDLISFSVFDCVLSENAPKHLISPNLQYFRITSTTCFGAVPLLNLPACIVCGHLPSGNSEHLMSLAQSFTFQISVIQYLSFHLKLHLWFSVCLFCSSSCSRLPFFSSVQLLIVVLLLPFQLLHQSVVHSHPKKYYLIFNSTQLDPSSLRIISGVAISQDHNWKEHVRSN